MTLALTVPRPDGALLHVQVDGPPHGHPLLLLQGQNGSHDWWTGLRERFHDEARTITMDYRGTGTTQAPDGALTTALLADDAAAVLETLEIASAHVYGTSMGGRVAQILAARYPGRVRSLVLACTSPGGAGATERSTEVRKALASPDPLARIATMMDLFYTPAWGSDPSRSHLFGDPSMSPVDRGRHLRMSAQHDAWDLLPTIDCPTLVLHGRDDRMTPSINAERIAERIPGARLWLHPVGRHGFFDEFANDLDPLLRSHWSSSS